MQKKWKMTKGQAGKLKCAFGALSYLVEGAWSSLLLYDTEMCHHILYDCPIYKQTELENLGLNPKPSKKFDYFLGHFKIIGNNLGNYYTRKIHEAFQILLHEPELNKQVKSYELVLK